MQFIKPVNQHESCIYIIIILKTYPLFYLYQTTYIYIHPKYAYPPDNHPFIIDDTSAPKIHTPKIATSSKVYDFKRPADPKS